MKRSLYVLILLAIFIWIIIAGVVLNHILIKSYTLEEITGIDLDDIKYVESNMRIQMEEYNLEVFKNEFSNKLFRKNKYIDEKVMDMIPEKSNYSGFSLDVTFICYDENNNTLLTIIDSRGEYYITKGFADSENMYNGQNLYYEK